MVVVERVGANLGTHELSLSEPRAVFLVTDGVGREEETTMTLSEWKSSVKSAAAEWKSLKTRLAQIRGRERNVSRRKSRGTERPSVEKRQILSQIKKDSNIVDSEIGRNRSRRKRLAREGRWLLRSSPENPLRVKLNADGSDEIISGKPLDEAESAWRIFALREGDKLVAHPSASDVRQYFMLRRNEQLGIEKVPGEARSVLDIFLQQAVDRIPEELTLTCSRISNLDFQKPLLPEFEILQREN